jgi:hypothetical protein
MNVLPSAFYQRPKYRDGSPPKVAQGDYVVQPKYDGHWHAMIAVASHDSRLVAPWEPSGRAIRLQTYSRTGRKTSEYMITEKSLPQEIPLVGVVDPRSLASSCFSKVYAIADAREDKTYPEVLIGEAMVGTQAATSRPDWYGALFLHHKFVFGVDHHALGYRHEAEPSMTREGMLAALLPYSQHVSGARYIFSHVAPLENTDAAAAISRGYEGVVWKPRHHWRRDIQTWLREKEHLTVDYVVTGWDVSSSDTHRGNMKAVHGSLFDEAGNLVHVVTVGGGWTTEFRAEFAANPASFMGRVMEVQGKALFKSGAVRHPNFVRWRGDKSAQDCRLSMLPFRQ